MKFKLNLGKWLQVTGENLKGHDLAIALLFLAFVIAAVAAFLATVALPKVQGFL